jgi:hypothetical protein
MIGTARQRILRAMRRVLALVSVLGVALLGTGPTPTGASAAPSLEPSPGQQEAVVLALKVEGFWVEVLGEDNDGDQTATLIVSRGRLPRGGPIAEYIAPATLTDHSLTAKFGSLGELNFEFKPRKCRGGLAFSGSFTFTGENGYVHIDADHAEGSFLEQIFTACGPLGPIKPGQVHRIVSTVHLEADTGSLEHGVARRVEAFEDRTEGGRRSVKISAFVGEEREGMTVARGAILRAPREAFRWNLKAGTATLRPPAPFSGSATLKPGPGSKGTWTGSLRVRDITGGPPIELAGPTFHAHLREEHLTEE